MAETKDKSSNPERIFRLLRTERELTKQDIAQRLHLSMPTALQNVNTMLEAGFLEECGSTESTGGRKAKKLRLNRGAGYGVGVNIALHQVELAVTDLLGTALYTQALPLVFCDETDWYQELGQQLERFLRECGVDGTRVLGCGISFPGIVDDGAGMLIRSHVFGLEHVGLDRFQKAIPYPVTVANDANCACFVELCSGRGTYLYLSLSESVGGAVMIGQRLLLGDSFQAGEVGHMLLVPGGKRCYCGKAGCADAYLSPNVLTGGVQTLDGFFCRLRAGEQTACETWDAYLDHLAMLATNLRMAFNLDIVLGGEVGGRMEPYMDALRKKAAQYDRFARDVDYLYPCTCRLSAFAVGAAMLALERYGSRLFQPLSEIKESRMNR